jgi:P27 family predicted phage terminase small subunit
MVRGVKPTMRTDKAAISYTPRVPAWLSADAKTEWRRIMPLLIERKVVTDADMGSVENYCVSIGRVREIERLIQAEGGAIDARLFRMQDKAAQTARQLAAELGLTPVSRSRPVIRDDRPDDEIDALDI